MRTSEIQWKKSSEFFSTIDRLEAGAEWKCQLYSVPGDEGADGSIPYEECEFWYRDIVEVHEELIANPDLKNDSTYIPTKQYTDSSKTVREYDEAMSGDWAHRTQVSVIVIPVNGGSQVYLGSATSWRNPRSCNHLV